MPRKKKKVETSKIKKVNVGVSGVDEILDGGIPENSLVLLAGTCGTGKTTFGLQFLYQGIKNGENGVYVTLEEIPERLELTASLFGWDLKKLEKEKKLLIIKPELYKYESLVADIEDAVKNINAKRLVIDSMAILGSYFSDSFELRRKVLELNEILKGLNCTTLAISEIEEGTNKISRYGIEEFTVDGVVILYYIKRENNFLRAIAVRKMRNTPHSSKIHPLEITNKGLEVFPTEEIFAKVWKTFSLNQPIFKIWKHK